MTDENKLVNYYNKFNEDKRLDSRHGQVEFNTTFEYIKKYLKNMNNPKILDVGAGCGKYSITLADMGYDVTAVELVKHNLRVIEQKSDKVKAYQGNAVNLSRFKDNSFDLILLFGPLYHLLSFDEQLQALLEAKRVLKDDGIIMVAYCMNDYAIIRHGFMDHNILNDINKIDSNFNINISEDDLYNYVRLDYIDELNKKANLKRIEIITPDGPTDYIRDKINDMSDEEFSLYKDYIISISNRTDIIGMSSHTVDIIKKQ